MKKRARSNNLWTLFTTAASLTAAACAPADAPDDGLEVPPGSVDATEQDLVGGTASTGAPEVGQYHSGTNSCTATLIAPHFALTAGHCFDGGEHMQNTPISNLDSVAFTLAGSGTQSIPVLRARSFSSYFRQLTSAGLSHLKTDVALLWLQSDVTNIAPAALATILPGDGQLSVTWGYGCTNQDTENGGGYKQYRDFTYPSLDAVCPGDSGGPARYLTHADNGSVWGVNSGSGSADTWGAVVPYRAKILAMMAPGGWDAWSEWFPTAAGFDGDEGDGEAPDRARLTVHTSAQGRSGVYWAKSDGSVWGKHTNVTAQAPWQPGNLTPAYQVAPASSANAIPGGRMTAISPTPGATSLYWVTTNGAIRNTYWTGSAWAAPFNVAPSSSVYAAGNVATLSTKPNGSSVFWITPSGALRSSWYDPAAGTWVFDYLVHPSTGAVPWTQLSALSTQYNHSALYWIGTNGAIRTTYYDTAAWKWVGPYDLTAPGEGSAGAKVTAVSTIAGGTTLFWTNSSGTIRTTFRTQSTNWAAPYSLSGTNAAIAGSAVEAVSTTYGNVSTYYQSPTNALMTRYYANNAWQPAAQLGGANQFMASQPFSVVSPWSNGTSLFYTDGDGRIMSRFFDPR